MTDKMDDQGVSQATSQGNDYDNDDELTADPELTQYFRDLQDALHGSAPGRAREPLTWNGVAETTVVLDSIRSTLDKAIPPPRPLPDQHGK